MAEQSPKNLLLAFGRGRFQHDLSKPNHQAVEQLRELATAWRNDSQHFYAGYVFKEAIHYAWGDSDLVAACAIDALREFESAVSATDGTPPLEVVASLQVWATELGMNWAGFDRSAVRDASRALDEELAERLLLLAEETEDPRARAGLLVRGFHLETDFEGAWHAEFPEFEVHGNTTRFGGGSIVMTIPSAFHIFVRGGDYVAAETVAEACPEAFTSHGLRGWRTAVTGLLKPEEAVERFAEAADEFARDTFDERAAQEAGGWSSINVDLWAKYFRGRAAVAEIVRAPECATSLLGQARSALEGTESGWVNPQVTCFRILVTALEEIFGVDPAESTSQAKKAIIREARIFGFDDNDRLALEFLERAGEAFAEIRQTPETALVSGALPAALELLGRIPLVGAEVASAIRRAIGERAMAELLGQHQTWIYRTIESVTDESILRRLLQRLLQGQLPLYAQIRHGPIEYGKDIVALVEVGGKNVLRMYQVKVGDITKASWPKTRDELEEMFQVGISNVQLPVEPDDRLGILVFNGHLNTYVEPVASAWLDEQKDDHHRAFEIMHLDAIVTWIVRDRLVNELRVALDELGVSVVMPS